MAAGVLLLVFFTPFLFKGMGFYLIFAVAVAVTVS